MNNIWYIIMIVIGFFMFIGGLSKSNFIIYRLLVARSEKLWGKNVHRFYQVAGILLMGFGILLTLGIIGK
ncbi:MAG: hypothetical protein JXQ65_08845 [Candidatus Marinimicrobia bacterium]|nr:hypothetical protein [Candidatus Neomarinimicrobiota bacterium]